MVIKLKKELYNLGEAIPVEIIYSNTINEDIELEEDPSLSLDVIMNVVDKESSENRNYSMGKLVVTSLEGDQFALVAPIKEPFIIKPGEDYRFTSDINSRLQLLPGQFDCYLEDQKADRSNRVAIVIRYTRESVDLLLKTASSPDEEYGRREWAMDLIREIYPAFRLKLPLPEESDASKTEKESHNAQMEKEFSLWWNKNRDSAEVEKTLQKLNKDQSGV